MRWIGIFLALGLATGFPEICAAASGRIDVGEVIVHAGGGHLPVGPSVTKAEAIAAAYQMPAVQAAITHMGALGYIAHSVYDDAGLAPGAPATFVALSFEKPGLFAPSFDVIGAPMILIGTVREASGQMITRVTGGLAFVDTTAKSMWAADSLPAQYPRDQSWEVVPAGGGDYGLGDDPGGLKRVSPSSARSWIGPFSFTGGGTNSPEDRRFRKFVHCSSIGLGGAALNALWQGPPIPQKVVIQAAVMGVISVISCGVGAYGGIAP
jgi:hypothetical protein